MAASLSTFVVSWNEAADMKSRCLGVGSACDTLEYLLGGGGHGVAYGDYLEVAAFECRVLVAEFACGNNLTRLHAVAVACVDYYFLAPDAVVLFHELALVDNLLFEEACVARVEDVDFAHHLAYDDFEVLVVDLHTPHAVYILHLVTMYSCTAVGPMMLRMSAGVVAPSDRGVPART